MTRAEWVQRRIALLIGPPEHMRHVDAIRRAHAEADRMVGFEPEPAKKQGTLGLVVGMLFRREETSMKLSKSAVKAAKGVVVVLVSATIAGLGMDNVHLDMVKELANLPFADQIATAVISGVLYGLDNIRKHIRK